MRNGNVVLVNECIVQLERHSQVCFRKQCQCLLNPRAKHPVAFVFGVASPVVVPQMLSCSLVLYMHTTLVDIRSRSGAIF